MRIRQSARVREQVALASELQAELLRLIRKKLLRAESAGAADEWASLRRLVELSAPGFQVKTRPKTASEIDRRASMLTGPFYTSDDYPIPQDEAGEMMFPILQLSLDSAWPAIGQRHDDGLLQLWHGRSEDKALVRIVPAIDAYEKEPTPFLWRASKAYEDSLIPPGWNLDPCGNAIQEIVELVATGFECQGRRIEACYSMVAPEEPEWLWTLLRIFIEKAPYRSGRRYDEIKLFGTFYGIQYDAADVGKPCLMSMSWGASGGAELFYQASKGRPLQFEFWSCGR